jgi:hypothetical protein
MKLLLLGIIIREAVLGPMAYNQKYLNGIDK